MLQTPTIHLPRITRLIWTLSPFRLFERCNVTHKRWNLALATQCRKQTDEGPTEKESAVIWSKYRKSIRWAASSHSVDDPCPSLNQFHVPLSNILTLGVHSNTQHTAALLSWSEYSFSRHDTERADCSLMCFPGQFFPLLCSACFMGRFSADYSTRLPHPLASAIGITNMQSEKGKRKGSGHLFLQLSPCLAHGYSTHWFQQQTPLQAWKWLGPGFFTIFCCFP